MENNVYENPVPEEQVAQEDNSNILAKDLEGEEISASQDVESSDVNAENGDLDLGEESEEEVQTEEKSTIALTAEELSAMSREEMIKLLAQIIETQPLLTLRKDVELIKVCFYKATRAKNDADKKAFIQAGGVEEKFTIESDGLDSSLKELISQYRQKRDNHLVVLESQKNDNLKIKLQIIDELKELINSNETINNTFATFRSLQERWKESGVVPKSNIKDLWESYHMHVENFYNFVKINKELRDLDLKKNYEMKLEICESAEALLLDESVVASFNKLQKLHDSWREIGPVAIEFKEVLWQRFKEASSKINKAHQDHFETIKQEQIANLALKTELCQKCEELSNREYTNKKEWDDASNELIEIQNVWKTIGFAPKSDNNTIYSRFRAACDLFFDKKRVYFLTIKNEMEENLQRRVALCVQAETIADGDDWKGGAAELIALQQEWKKVGPIPRKQSDAIWKRFRAACDRYFEKKSAHFADIDKKYEGNLEAKRALIEQIKAYECQNIDEGFATLKEFQRQWVEIGFVPMRDKESLQSEYKKVIDAKFDALKGSDNRRNIDKFKSRIDSIKTEGNSRKISSERERILSKIKDIESDITVWENNIGFFAGGKNSQKLINDVNIKIEKAKGDIKLLQEKLVILNEN